MTPCQTCSNGVFDPVWCEYKCLVYETRVRGVMCCDDYKKKVEEKENEDILHLGEGSAREGHDGELHVRGTGGEG